MSKSVSFKSLFIIIIFILYTLFIPYFKLSSWANIIIDLILFGLCLTAYKTDIRKGLNKTRNHFFKTFGYVFLFWFILIICYLICNGIINNIFDIIPHNTEAQIELLKLNPIYLVLSMLVFSPLVEELTIRKGFRDIINNKYIYLLLSSAIYGLLYVCYSPTSISYLFVITYFISGLIYGISYLKSKNIMVPMLIHFLQNCLMLVIYMLSM